MRSPSAAVVAEPPPPAPRSGECRCACGSLLARQVPGGVELKCRRCRRTVFIAAGASGGRTGVFAEVDVHGSGREG